MRNVNEKCRNGVIINFKFQTSNFKLQNDADYKNSDGQNFHADHQNFYDRHCGDANRGRRERFDRSYGIEKLYWRNWNFDRKGGPEHSKVCLY